MPGPKNGNAPEMAVGGIQGLRADGISDGMMSEGRPFFFTWLDGYNAG